MNDMKKIGLFSAVVVALLTVGCNSQPHECAPSALDVIMSRTSIRSFTGDPVSKEQLETREHSLGTVVRLLVLKYLN